MRLKPGVWKAAAVLAAAVALTACAARGTQGEASKGAGVETEVSGEEPCQIVLWHYYNDVQKESLDKLVDEYNRTEGKEKQVEVKAVSQGAVNELSSKMDLMINDSTNQIELPNMFMAYRDMASKIWRNNPDLLVDCKDYFDSDDLARYNEAYIKEGYFGDGLYIIPLAKSTELLMMNQTELDRFLADNPGVDGKSMATWEGLAGMAEAYYNWTDAMTPDVPQDGKPFIGMDTLANYFIVMNHAMGSEIYHYGEDGQLVLDLDQADIERLFENYYIPYTKGYYGAFGKYRSDDIRQSMMAGYIGSSSSTLFFPKEVTDSEGNLSPIELGIYQYPCLDGEKGTAIQQGAGVVTIRKDAREDEACMDFIRWLTTERGFEMALSMSYMPVLNEPLDEKQKSAVTDPVVLRALEVELKQSQDYQMVYGFDFENAYSVRQGLEEYFRGTLSQGRQEFVGYLESGLTTEEAAQEMQYDRKAEEFYQQIRALFEG